MMPDLLETARSLAVGEARGFRGPDGKFDFERQGARWFIFKERDDLVYYRIDTGELATLESRTFALGTMWISNPWTYSLDDSLKIVSSFERWLQLGGKAVHVLDWARAYDELNACPRVEVDESIRGIYDRSMRPRRMPVVHTAMGR